MFDQILAKSQRPGSTRPPITLSAHARDVLAAVDVMFGTPGRSTRLAKQWLRFFKLPEEAFGPFVNNLRLAALFHDLGKANDGFQWMVRGEGHQDIRHEHLSALMLWLPEMQQWLRQPTLQADGVVPEIVVGAVLSHHLKASPDSLGAPLHLDPGDVHVYADAPEVAAVLGLAADRMGVSPPDIARHAGVWTTTGRSARGTRTAGVVGERAKELSSALSDCWDELEDDDGVRRLMVTVKAALLAVDSAGSAAPRTGRDLRAWLDAAFTTLKPLRPEDIDRLVIEPRRAQLQQANRWKGWLDFQIRAGELGPRALLIAGCGSGKTLAAWRWVAAQLASQKATRVLFLYPTRATATEGFRDYVSWAGPEEAALSSGTATFDLQELFENPGKPNDPRSGNDYTVEERLFALGFWERRVFSATVDTFLACMVNRYAALCLLPLLVDSVVVVDEVHSFDQNMFRALTRLLEEFDVPVLCMTASLPAARRDLLTTRYRLELYPSDPSAFPQLARQAGAPRYLVDQTTEDAAYALTEQAVQAGKSVMWVVNTVRRCQRVARRLAEALGNGVDDPGPVHCYHSRFKLEDRRRVHGQVVDAFKRPDDERAARAGRVLVTTQVCEMSLDLDADVLITELAPVPALIQRMGRCCRQDPPGERRGHVHAYVPEGYRVGGPRGTAGRPAPGAAPYTADELDQGDQFVAVLAQRDEQGKQREVCQDDLAALLKELVPEDRRLLRRARSAFPDSGPFALARDDQFRDENEYVVDAILADDIDAWLAERTAKRPADGLVVPVPRRYTGTDERLGSFLQRAEGGRYQWFLGYREEVEPDGQNNG